MMVIRTRLVGIATAVILFGGIALGAAIGVWRTTSSKEPAKIQSGEYAGMPNPSDIRGSYTWADVAKAFSIPETSLLKAFGSEKADEKVNTLESRYAGVLPQGSEIGTDSVRLFTALYTGLPHTPNADTVLPISALPILRAEGKTKASILDEFEARAFRPETQQKPTTTQAPSTAASRTDTTTIKTETTKAKTDTATSKTDAATSKTDAASAKPDTAADKTQTAEKDKTAQTSDHVPTPGSVVGKTTFADLRSMGFDMAKVENILGGLGASGQTIKDYCTAKGLTFSEIKAKLEAIAPK
jgi:hypothetical protein